MVPIVFGIKVSGYKAECNTFSNDILFFLGRTVLINRTYVLNILIGWSREDLLLLLHTDNPSWANLFRGPSS